MDSREHTERDTQPRTRQGATRRSVFAATAAALLGVAGAVASSGGIDARRRGRKNTNRNKNNSNANSVGQGGAGGGGASGGNVIVDCPFPPIC